MERKTVLFLLVALLVDAVGLLAGSSYAQARPLLASFAVNDTTDLVDGNLADGVCHTTNNTCTLRAAIMQANALGGSNSITLPSGIFTLTITGGSEDDAATGDLDVKSNLTINGTSADSTVMDGNGTDRVFEIFGGIQVNISNLTIRNGKSNTFLPIDGGGIRNNSSTVNLSSVTISDNVGGQGGGIYSNGALILTNATIKNNTAGVGGGIASNSGTLAITNSTITNNKSTTNSGGILSIGTAMLTNVVISNNTVTDTNGIMGGIGIGGTAELTNVTIISNTAPYDSGGIGNGGTTTIISSTISGNHSQYGGGLFSGNQGRLTISGSTISTNTAATGAGISAGGYLTLTNITISGNTARFVGGGMENGGTAILTNVTFSGNTITDTLVPRTGGTLFNSHYASSTLTLKNTIVANTFAGGDCLVDRGSIISTGYNISSDNSCPFTATGDMTNTNPFLGSLQLNAPGSTLTHALLLNSPAIDKGDNIGCPSVDQRGAPRPQNGRCDIGAFGFDPILYRYLFLPRIAKNFP